ncbi:MAG: aspartyl/asparaginyl beta-hydroxylase domain-containing protein [Lacipirellulaceae bacterium]
MATLHELGNRLLIRGVGGDSRPVVYDVDRVCPALRTIESGFATIREELTGILPSRAAIPRYHEVDRGRSHLSSDADGDASWRVFMLYAMGAKPAENRARCPQTAALVDSVPGLFQAFFSILEPRKSIPAHHSPYAGYLRYHLPLIVPTDNPPRMRVKDHWHTWREGEGLLFCDYWEHEVENHSDHLRVVLIIDIFRPMPPLRHWINRLVTRTYLRRAYGKRVATGQQPDL